MENRYDDAHYMMRQARRECESANESANKSVNKALDAWNYYHLTDGRVNLAIGKPEIAYSQFQSASSLHPYNPYFIIYQARAALHCKDTGECSRLVQRVLDLVAETPFLGMRQKVHQMAEELSC